MSGEQAARVGHVPDLAAFVFEASLANRTKFTRKTTSAFLAALAGGWSITKACRDAGISNRTYYDWREEHPEFAVAADRAIEQGTDKLEDIAWERATRPLDGSDTMLIFLLKARRPAKYRETIRNEHTGPDGKDLTIIFAQRDDGPQ